MTVPSSAILNDVKITKKMKRAAGINLVKFLETGSIKDKDELRKFAEMLGLIE